MKNTLPIPEDELITALKDRSQRAYSVLYDTYAPSLLGVINRIVKDTNKAEDLLQETFVTVWSTIDSYNANRERLFIWLLNIARSTALNFLRTQQSPPSTYSKPLPDTVVYPEQKSTIRPGSIDSENQRTNIIGLDPNLRQMIDLIYFEGYTQQKVADNLNMPLGMVKTSTRTALQQLKALFSNAL